MLRSAWALLLLPLIAGCQQTFRIAGTVVQHGSNQPLKNVLVTIRPIEHRDLQVSFLTAADGNFAFQNIPAGKYTLEVQRRGEQPKLFQQNEGFSTAIAVGPGLDSEHIVFPLDTPGSISGSVVDEQGDPVQGAQIWLFRKGIASGKSQVVLASMRPIDSSGAFHFGHLAAGTYFVAAQARPWYAQSSFQFQTPEQHDESNSHSEFDVAYPVTYYADSVDPASASPVVLSEGGTATIQIALRPVPAVRVELTGLDQPNQGIAPMLFATGPGGYQIPAQPMAFGTNNRQVITGIAPGRYTMVTHLFSQGKSELRGQKILDLTGDSTLNIHDLPRTSVSGQVIVSGDDFPNDGVVVQLSNGGQAFNAPVAKDRTFNLSTADVVSGRYNVQLANAPGFYVKSVAIKGRKGSDDEIDVTEGAALQISVIAGKGVSRINGIAISGDKPVPGAMVLLLPSDLSRTAFIRRDQSDSDGTFTLNEVPPGRYTLLAIDDGRDFAYEEPSVIKPYLSQGETLDVPLRNDSRLKVNVIARQRQ